MRLPIFSVEVPARYPPKLEEKGTRGVASVECTITARGDRGYATEAVAAMLQELAGSYGVTRFAAVLKQANLRSKRLLQGLGFVPAAAEAALARQLLGDEILMQLGSGPERRGVCFSDRRV